MSSPSTRVRNQLVRRSFYARASSNSRYGRCVRFAKRDDWLSWEPIDGFTVPASKRPSGEPIDPAAVLERLIRERRPAA